MACAGTTVKGELIPIDMYIMLDKSGSMAELTGAAGNGPSKWEAVSKALSTFFDDKGSNGLGVGLQFFPINKPGVPDSCTSDNQCGAGAPCLLKSCDDQPSITPCKTDNDCGFLATCATLGQCANDTNFYCFYNDPNFGPDCGMDANGNDLGKCKPIVSSFCLNADTCTAGDYGTPAVEISKLNGAATKLKNAISQTAPGGSTPTAPALDGAIKHAQTWAKANPDHKVITVLATDGLPTECDPTDIPSIAKIAADGKAGNPSILTFVIGVFGANDAGAQANLNSIASKGGTTQAFFIMDNQDVSMAFLDALHKIQGKTLSCEYKIPPAPSGSELDYGKVNVEYTAPGAMDAETIFYVSKASACDKVTGGWYYDVDPASGGVPTKIEMCPASCDKLKVASGTVDIQVGCQTVVPK